MSCKPGDVVFGNLNQIALYTAKMTKRLIKTSTGARIPVEILVQNLIEVVEFNLSRLKVDRKWYFDAIRDYSRVFHNEWDQVGDDGSNSGRIRYNNLLVVVALRLGLEKVWPPDGGIPFTESMVSEVAACVFPDRSPKFLLKHLDQSEALFNYFAKHSPYLEKVQLPLSDNDSFMKCVKFKNLRVLELAGGVSDKVLCNALWNVSSKKSDKVLEMALKETKDSTSWQLSLPHLEILRNNMLKNETQKSAMRISLGAAALAIQPKMDTVESMLSWGTFEAILHLLNMEAKHKTTTNNQRKLEVTTLSLHYKKGMNMYDLRRVVLACPKLTSLKLTNTKNINEDMSVLVAILPVPQLKQLTLDAIELSDLEFTVLLAEMKGLEHLTLRVTPQSIFNYNLPIAPCLLADINDDDYKVISMFPSIKTLVLEFVAESGDDFDNFDVGVNQDSNVNTESIISFLAAFRTTKEIYFRNTLLIPPSFLVFGCFGGAIAVLHNLSHISVISCSEDIPRLPTYCDPNLAGQPHMGHFLEVQKLLPDLQEDVTFKHLEKLSTIEIDEFYVSSLFDNVIKALRLSGVCVSILYRKGLKYS